MFEDYVARIGDRTGLYSAVSDLGVVGPVLYPGSYLDSAPMDVWPDVVFVDNDRTYARRVRALEEVPTGARFLVADYREPVPEIHDGWAALLISMYAGPVSRYCTRYLRRGGHLLANNSHGDASLAIIDPRYRLVAVQPHAGARFVLAGLEEFQEPKKPADLALDAVLASGRGVAFLRPAQCYLFALVGSVRSARPGPRTPDEHDGLGGDDGSSTAHEAMPHEFGTGVS